MLDLTERLAKRNANYAEQLAGFSITYTSALVTDNAGQPCGYCDTEGALDTRTVYGVDLETQENVALDCCPACWPFLVVDYLDVDQPVTVETTTFLPNDRMHGPDCTCSHPDGE